MQREGYLTQASAGLLGSAKKRYFKLDASCCSLHYFKDKVSVPSLAAATARRDKIFHSRVGRCFAPVCRCASRVCSWVVRVLRCARVRGCAGITSLIVQGKEHAGSIEFGRAKVARSTDKKKKAQFDIDSGSKVSVRVEPQANRLRLTSLRCRFTP
jgi:hypothetical protein